MMQVLLHLPVLLSVLALGRAQSFLQAISTYPELSEFSNLLSTSPSLATGLLSENVERTVLVPNNNALLAYQQQLGQGLGAVPADLLRPFLQYHVLDGSYDANAFQPETGVTIPTLLTGEVYNNRSAGSALSSVAASSGDIDNNGQVIFAAPQESGPVYVQSGLGQQVNLTTTNGTFDGGRFHIIDGALTLPQVCTATIKNQGLTSLFASLERTGLSGVLDTLNNVTCLAPNDAAFIAAGSPDSKLDVGNLTNALMFHTIPGPLYSNFLQSGQTFTTAGNDTVRVTIQNGEIFFNDAKVLKPNVLTNNGLIHVLDRIMSPLSSDSTASPAPTNLTSSTQPSGTTGSTATATNTGFIEVSGSDSVIAVSVLQRAFYLSVIIAFWL